MHLQLAVQNAFGQMTDVMDQLTNAQYTQSCENLSGATIGQHTRHIIEMYQCLLTGLQNDMVNYESRQRDIRIECDKDFAAALLAEIEASINQPNRTLKLYAGFDTDTHEQVQLDTNFYREIAYNLEHTIHHMALIKVGLLELSGIRIPDGYGVASSTIKYQRSCVQ
ncbi:DinB family protein [Flavihumibacter sp. UBA7668]|uniref:DinB family protein n=1 Tax=Flavihumibacter sp. UBA7668 TaxID=1946542 RepID=UPI0025C45791|nr:DinB family protein [Flavihumibacter sp. UBA7668]